MTGAGSREPGAGPGAAKPQEGDSQESGLPADLAGALADLAGRRPDLALDAAEAALAINPNRPSLQETRKRLERATGSTEL